MMYLATAINDRDDVLIPAVISLFTLGKAYHSELVFSDGNAIVVTPKTFNYVKHSYDWYEWSLVPLPMISAEDEAKIRKATDDILATKPEYDYVGACLGQLGKVFNSKRRWYCSELCRHLIKDYVPNLGDERKFISPSKLWKRVANSVTDYQPNYTPDHTTYREQQYPVGEAVVPYIGNMMDIYTPPIRVEYRYRLVIIRSY